MSEESAFTWNDETEAELRQMHLDGFSFGLIVAQFRQRYGSTAPTRSACIGKAMRLGLGKRVDAPRMAIAPAPRQKKIKIPAQITPPGLAQGDGRESVPWLPPVNPSPVAPTSPPPATASACDGRDAASSHASPALVRHVTLLELENWMCRFPIGEPRSPAFRYCGAEAIRGESYCPACRARAYTRVGMSETALREFRAKQEAQRARQFAAEGV